MDGYFLAMVGHSATNQGITLILLPRTLTPSLQGIFAFVFALNEIRLKPLPMDSSVSRTAHVVRHRDHLNLCNSISIARHLSNNDTSLSQWRFISALEVRLTKSLKV